MSKIVDVVVYVQVPAGLSLQEIETQVLLEIAQGRAQVKVSRKSEQAQQR